MPVTRTWEPAVLRRLCTLLVFGLCVAVAGPASALQSGFMGIGVASSIIGGELQDEFTTQEEKGTAYHGVPDRGIGWTLGFTYRANALFAWDIEWIVTGSSAMHSQLPDVHQTVATRSILAGGRLTWPIGDVFEVYGRGSVGVWQMDWNDAFPDLSRNVPLSGFATALGGGVIAWFGTWALQLAYVEQDLSTLDVIDPATHTTTLSLIIGFDG